MHEFFHGQDMPEKIAINFKKRPTFQTSTRSNNDQYQLYYTLPNLVSSYKKPTLAAAVLWNKLPLELRSIKSKNSFKIKLKDYFISQYT